jgi:hypothetical protein
MMLFKNVPISAPALRAIEKASRRRGGSFAMEMRRYLHADSLLPFTSS